jgi:hypothetical protein
MPNWFDDNAPAPATPEAKNTPPGGDWFAQNAPPAETSTPTEQPFPKYGAPKPPAKTPEETQSDIRQSAVAGLTGMPTPNMTEEDKASFERGKATGAVTATAVSAAPLVAEAAGPIGTAAKWVKDNPVLAGIGYHVARELGIPLPKMLDVLSKFKD